MRDTNQTNARRGQLARRHWPRLISLRASGAGVREIAGALGLASHGPVSEALRLPEVAREVAAIQERALAEAKAALRAGATGAVRALTEIAEDPKVDPSVRVKAATALLDRVGLGAAGHRTLTVQHEGEVTHRPLIPREDLRQLDATERASLARRLEAKLAAMDDDAEPDCIDAEPADDDTDDTASAEWQRRLG